MAGGAYNAICEWLRTNAPADHFWTCNSALVPYLDGYLPGTRCQPKLARDEYPLPADNLHDDLLSESAGAGPDGDAPVRPLEGGGPGVA